MIYLHNFLGGEIEHDLTRFAVFRLCNESTGFGEMGVVCHISRHNDRHCM